MALSELKFGQCVQFQVGERKIHAKVAREPLPGQRDALLVDIDGQLYDQLPEDCDKVPGHVARSISYAIDRIMKTAKFKRRMRAHGRVGAVRTTRRRKARDEAPHGMYGTAKTGYVGFNSYPGPGKTYRGVLAVRDIPFVLTEGLTGTPTNHLCRLIQIDMAKSRRLELDWALRKLEHTHPDRADAFRRVYLGGLPWFDANGVEHHGPMRVADVAAMRGTSSQAVSNAVRRAKTQLQQFLGWTMATFWSMVELEAAAREAELEEPQETIRGDIVSPIDLEMESER